MGRAMHSIITSLFVITIRVLVNQGGKFVGLNHETVDFHHENQGT